MQLQKVYETWVKLDRCSSARLGVELGLTEASAARLLTQAIVAANSGAFGKQDATPEMKLKPLEEGRVK